MEGCTVRFLLGLGSILVKDMQVAACCSDSHRKWGGWGLSDRLSCAASTGPKCAKHSYLVKSWKCDRVLGCWKESWASAPWSLIFLSLLSLQLWQSHGAPDSLLASHMVLIRKEKYNWGQMCP